MSVDRRKDARYEAVIEVAFKNPESFVREYSKNLSRGGAFVQTDTLPDRNALVELALKIPGVEDPLKIVSRVVRTVTISHPDNEGRHLYGVGFRFLEWDLDTKEIFYRYFEKLEKSVKQSL